MSNLQEKVAGLLAQADSEILQEFMHDNMQGPWVDRYHSEFLAIATSAGISWESQEGYGGEDMGSEYWHVYSFTDGKTTVYVKFDGWYASHYGSEFNEWFFVTPTQVTKTVFKKA